MNAQTEVKAAPKKPSPGEVVGMSDNGLGRSPLHPLPTLDWPDDNPPPSWWGVDEKGQITKIYRDYEAYCDD